MGIAGNLSNILQGATPALLKILQPTNGATVPIVHDITGRAPVGSTVELWYVKQDGSGGFTGASVIADPMGSFLFVGDTPTNPGPVTWFVKADGAESARVSVTVVPGVYDPADHTVDEVKQHVTEHPDEIETILAAEQARGDGARSTLISWLEGRIAE